MRNPLPAVLSLNVQPGLPPDSRVRSQFEIMVRHLFDRMLNNEAFGDDAAARMTELAGAIAIPGLLVALFLFPAYHGLPPHPLERPYWSQACDHLFFVTYSFVVLGLAMIFQWDMLFPDLLDVYVLTSLPVQHARMLWGRIAAMGIFLGLVQIETSALGMLFFPGVADLKTGFFHHFAAHAAAVTLAGGFAAAFFLALQGVLGCLPFPRLANRAASVAKILSVIALLMILFLFPLAAHYLEVIVGGKAAIARWCPPFWFLGVYQTLLYGRAAQPIFHELARIGVWSTMALGLAGGALYPLAYRRRVRQIIEGSASVRRRFPLASGFQRLLHLALVRTPAARAVFHFTAQTLGRLPRLHLYLAMYTGVGLALILSGLVTFRGTAGHLQIVTPADGVRLSIPLLAFWTVMGLRTALLSPLLLKGSWLFRVVEGKPREEGLRAASTLVLTVAGVLMVIEVLLLHFVEPMEMRTVPMTAVELLLGLGLSLILTDLAFLPLRTVPFTAAHVKTTRQLPVTLTIYLLVFPYFALKVQDMGVWLRPTAGNMLRVAIGFAVMHGLLRLARRRVVAHEPADPEVLFMGLGLREQ